MKNLKEVINVIKVNVNEIFKDKRIKRVYYNFQPTYESVPKKYHDNMMSPPYSHATHITAKGELGYSSSNISTHKLVINKGDNIEKVINNEIDSISNSIKIPKKVLLNAKYSFFRGYR